MTEDQESKDFRHAITTIGFVAFVFILGMLATRMLQPSVLTSCQTACGAQGVDHVTPAECVCRGGEPAVEGP